MAAALVFLAASSALIRPSPGGLGRAHFVRHAAPAALRARIPHLTEERTKPATKPFLQQEVPLEQQPSMEMREMSEQPFFGWAELPTGPFIARLLLVYALCSALISLPIALTTYDASSQLPQVPNPPPPPPTNPNPNPNPLTLTITPP